MTAKTKTHNPIDVICAMQMVVLFHAAIRMARKLRAANRDDYYANELLRSVSLALNAVADRDAINDVDDVRVWVLYLPTRKGNGFNGTIDCGRGHDDTYYWMVECPDGEGGFTWETVGVDDDAMGVEDGIYWGGELGSPTLMAAVTAALHYQAKWPEAVVRISMGENKDVLLIPAIDGDRCGICDSPTRLNGTCLNGECSGSHRLPQKTLEALGLSADVKMVPLAHIPAPDPSTYHGLCHVCNVAGTSDQGLCLDPDCPGSLPSPQHVSDEEVSR